MDGIVNVCEHLIPVESQVLVPFDEDVTQIVEL